MISYAQNFEDVMLWRALKHIKKGFYLDIGANDPINDSVTKWFYENGWHGINIEPLAAHFKDLVKDRPNDINLNFAIGESLGSIDLWVPERRGWATANLAVIDAHKKNGHKGEFITIEQKTLNQIFSEYVKNDIHFMKIDVEGFEKQVLGGLDLKKNRPWIIVIEATKPNSNVDNHKEWQHLIRPFDYSCIYFDGLNRFYLAKEHIDLAKNFNSPPNVFDEFSHWHSQVKIKESEAKLKESEAKAMQLKISNQNYLALAEEHQVHIQALLNSRSWKVTIPLRFIMSKLRSLKYLVLSFPLKKLFKKFLISIINKINKNQKLKAVLKPFFYKICIFDKLYSTYSRLLYESAHKSFLQPLSLEELSPSARKIYFDLESAIQKAKR